MKRSLLIIPLIIVLVGFGQAFAFGPIIYNNGGIQQGLSGNETTEWVQADDFILRLGGTVGDAGVYLATDQTAGNPVSVWDGTLQYFIFANNGGMPGTLLASGIGQNITTTDTGIPWGFGGNNWLFEFDLQNPFNAAPGTEYWFGIHLSNNFDRDGIYWTQTNDLPGNARESEGGTFNNWATSPPNGEERAYFLTGQSGEIPEPATMLLLASGLIGILGLRKKFRK
jgi:hypothetical protein